MERNIALIALFAALIAALGLVPSITLGLGVPISAQTLGVMLAGTVLGSKRGALAALLVVLLVALGLPLLAGGRGGIGVFSGPTVGFLLGWPVGAFVTGLIVERWRTAHLAIVAAVASVIGCILVIYAMGIVGMMIVLDLTPVQAAYGTMPFIPGDILKAVIAGLLTAAIYKARPQAVLSRQ
ncbi:MAG: BioY family transporter [Hyphomicrobiales bacterium]